jgi:hypothetical protein
MYVETYNGGHDSFWTEVLARQFDAADDSMRMGDAVKEV